MAKTTLHEKLQMTELGLPFEEAFQTAAERWREGHSGYDFAVFKNGRVIGKYSTFPEARAAARKAGRGATVRDMPSGTKYYTVEGE